MEAFLGAYASGVWFSASRRELRSINCSSVPTSIQSDESSGATPELARGTRALPILIANSEFGIEWSLVTSAATATCRYKL